MTADRRCGTYAGWNVHIRSGEKPCAACQSANRDYTQNYRLRRGLTQRTHIPIAALRQYVTGQDTA